MPKSIKGTTVDRPLARCSRL